MATKTQPKKSKSNGATSATASKARSGGKSKPSKSRSKGSTLSSRGNSRDGFSRSAAKSAAGGIKTAREAVGDAGQRAGKATSKAASEAKVPLIAGGAALVGVASGIALNAARSKSSKVLGVRVPKTKVKVKSKDLVKAADRVAGAGEQIGKLSTGFRELQGTSGADSGKAQHRSPVEVVLQGLTRRR